MKFSFFRRRTIWWPTWLGWLCLLLPAGTLLILWLTCGESFLSVTGREPADVLVVEGWIGTPAIREAKREFDEGGYKFLVTTGGPTGQVWDTRRWNYAVEAGKILKRLGVPEERLIVAPAQDVESQRTYESAVAAREMIESKGLRPAGINIVSRGPHARRSRLVFARVFGPDTKVGVIAWTPETDAKESWWHSSARAKDFLDETAGYFYELLLGSGRSFSHRNDESGTAPQPATNTINEEN